MNAFVRQLAVLSILWALCELLLPSGRQQPLVRMTASVLVITALLSTVGQWLGQASHQAAPALIQQADQSWTQSYRRAAVTAAANQLKRYCEHLAQRAGYEAEATVFLTLEGTLERAEVTVNAQAPLLSAPELRQELARRLGVEEARIWVVEP